MEYPRCVFLLTTTRDLSETVFGYFFQAALGTLSPMVDAAMGPGMTTPTPGVHGYPGAMPYSSAVPARGDPVDDAS